MFAANSVASSIPGTVWYRRTPPSGSYMAGGAYGNGVYLFGGQSAYLAKSTDLNTWTQDSGLRYPVWANGNAVYGLVYVGALSKFIAGGSYGTLATSTDGTTWTSNTGLSSTGWATYSVNSLVWSGSLLMAYGDTGRIATSTNGTTWSYKGTLSTLAGWASGAGPGASCYCLATDGTKFIAVGYLSSTSYCATSTDGGATWTNQPGLQTALSGAVPVCVAWCPTLSKWLVSTSYGKIASSSDGVTWTLVSHPSTGVAINCILDLGGYVVTVGAVTMVTTNGVAWTMNTSAGGQALIRNGNVLANNSFQVSP